MKRIEIDINMVKSSTRQFPQTKINSQRQRLINLSTYKDDLYRKNSLKNTYISKLITLHMIILYHLCDHFSTRFFSHMEKEHEFMGVVVVHELVSSRLNVRKRIYNYILYVGLIPLMFNEAGLHTIY